MNEFQDTSTNSQHALEVYVDLQTKLVVETANILTKGSVLYLAILAALTGYIFTQDIEKNVKMIFVSMFITISFLTAFSSAFVVWGIYQGIKSIEFTLRRVHESSFDGAKIGEFFLEREISLLDRANIQFRGFLGSSFCNDCFLDRLVALIVAPVSTHAARISCR